MKSTRRTSDANSPSSSPPCCRVEWAAFAAICLISGWLRISNSAGLAVEHFDEGVYASNLWFDVAQGYAYPMRHLYAPPLVPFLAEWSLILTGMAPQAPIWIGICAGWALIPSLWWVGRSWFGPLAGLTAAALAATSDLHVLFSRTILTEPWLLLGLLWAVFFLERAVRTGGKLDVLAAGVLTGVTWWTKYNGWLPLAIAGAGTVAHHVFVRRRVVGWPRELTRSLAAWAAAACLAALVWCPVPLGLHDQGGYSAVAANHRRYVVGLSGWWESAQHQLANLYALEGGSTRIVGPACVVGLMIIASRLRRTRQATQAGPEASVAPTRRNERRTLDRIAAWVAFVAPWLAVMATTSIPLLAAGLLAIAAVTFIVGRTTFPPLVNSSVTQSSCAGNQGLAFVVAWLAGLLVATPCYHPYARLTLPGVMSVWLGSGWALSQLRHVSIGLAERGPASSNTIIEDQNRRDSSRLLGAAVVVAMLLIVVVIGLGPGMMTDRPAKRGQEERGQEERGQEERGLAERDFVLGRQSRRGLALATTDLANAAARDAAARVATAQDTTASRTRDSSDPIVFYVYGEPAVFYHLRAAGQTHVAPVSDPAIVRPPAANRAIATYVITGPHAEDEAGWSTTRDRLIERHGWTLIARQAFQPSDVLRLDHEDPRTMTRPRAYELSLYRVRD